MSIFINGNIITLDNKTKAQAFCVRNNRFVAIGSNEEIKKLALKNEDIININGKTVVPGFNDSHMHFLNYAVCKNQLDLSTINSIAELIEKCKSFIEEKKPSPGSWILARGWNDNHFIERRLLSRTDLDKISVEHPIFFSRACNHIGALNSKAMELLNICSTTENPEGGVIDKENGNPTGILRENALELVFNSLPAMTKEEIKSILLSAFEDALKVGLTSLHSEDRGQARGIDNFISAYKELDSENNLPLRITLQLNLASSDDIEKASSLGLKSEKVSEYLKIGALKLYEDGSLGGRTAAMENNYEDALGNGVTIYSQEELTRLVLLAEEKGFQLAIHAIGDRAMKLILNSYRKLKELHPNKDLRPIIIHCQFTNSKLLKEFKELGVISNVQPSFVMTDWPIVERAIGKHRARESYAWKDMLQSGIAITFSSDAPIESFNPLYGIYAAVTRKNLLGNPENGWHNEQNISTLEALKAFTLGSAYMDFEENNKGSISEGKLADFVVLSEKILEIPSDKIKDIKVLETYVGGKLVYKL